MVLVKFKPSSSLYSEYYRQRGEGFKGDVFQYGYGYQTGYQRGQGLGNIFSKIRFSPMTIKLKIYCTQSELVEDIKTVKELIDQVYQFSRMYWKSVRQQNLPVTIKYPEMVAEMLPHFDGNEIPEFGKDNLWFL